MKGLSICRHDDAPVHVGHPIAGHAAGEATVRNLGPDDYSLWMVELTVAAGTPLELPAEHGDEVIYVSSGALVVDGARCEAGGVTVVESGAHPHVEVAEDAVLVHMGPVDPVVPTDGLNGPITRRPDQVHVVGPDGWMALAEPGRLSKYWVDSTCDGCRATLLYTSRDDEYVSSPHSHTVDELIHVLHGEIRLGAHTLGAGDTLAVEGGQRYGFRADHGFAFINYRRDASEHTSAAGGTRLEGALANGMQLVAAD